MQFGGVRSIGERVKGKIVDCYRYTQEVIVGYVTAALKRCIQPDLNSPNQGLNKSIVTLNLFYYLVCDTCVVRSIVQYTRVFEFYIGI